MSVPLEVLPDSVQVACVQLREQLLRILGPDLVALWVYGAVTFEDRPHRLGDVDKHAVLRRSVDRDTVRAIDALHGATARESGIEWDSWYILERDMASRTPPAHAFRENLVDRAWALHRAHWLGGQFVALYGRLPSDLVRPPTWAELEKGLRSELSFIERIVERGPRDAGHAAFVVGNGCRIIYSMRTRDVVVSKRAAARWALEQMPGSWHEPILAAGRAYDASLTPDDAAILQSAMGPIVAAVREEFV